MECPGHTGLHLRWSYNHLLAPLYFSLRFITVTFLQPLAVLPNLESFHCSYATMSNFLSWCTIASNNICEIQGKVFAPGRCKDESSLLRFQCFCEAEWLRKARLYTHQGKLNCNVLEIAFIVSFCYRSMLALKLIYWSQPLNQPVSVMQGFYSQYT